jgi:membrane fusion protein (multidrug efflux system)
MRGSSVFEFPETMNDSTPPQKTSKAPIAIAVLAAAAIGAGIWWWTSRGYESTDDAFIQADVTMVAPRVSGTVTKVYVSDNQIVAAGALLFELDAEDFKARLRQAQANLAAAKAQALSAQADLELTRTRAPAGVTQAQAGLAAARAQADRAKSDVTRYEALYAKDEVSKQILEQAQTNYRAMRAQADQAVAALTSARTTPEQIAAKEAQLASAQAAEAQAQAAVDQSALQLGYTQVKAPSAGRVTRKNVQLGSQLQAGAPVLALVGNAPWIVANFKETQLEHLRIGQPVDVKVDAYPGQHFTARVQSLQAGTGSAFSLLPAENATGNFVKVVQRVPVKLVFDPAPDAALHLAPGMSVVPRVDVRHEDGTRLAAAQ